MKRIKSQTANSSEDTSLNQSPTTKGLKEAMYDTSDNQSMIEEEVGSPAVSTFEVTEKFGVLAPQRSLSTPIFSNLNLTRATSQSSHKQLLNALDTLQKRIVEYQVLSVRDTIIKAALLSQGPLRIPSLNGSEEPAVNPVEKIISNLQNDEDDLEIYYGDVEYPLLHLAPKGMQVEEAKKKAKAGKAKGYKSKKAAKMSDCSSPASEQDDSLLESLTATRAGTQRSEPEMKINLRELSEQVAELIGQKNKKTKKNSKNEENVKIKEAVKKNNKNEKSQEKEKKQKAKRGAKEALLSPVLKGKRMTERRKNKWQDETELKI